jgi:hypothetical protein
MQFCCSRDRQGALAGHPADVYVNVYDMIGANAILGVLGLGVYHTGVEVYAEEIHSTLAETKNGAPIRRTGLRPLAPLVGE